MEEKVGDGEAGEDLNGEVPVETVGGGLVYSIRSGAECHQGGE